MQNGKFIHKITTMPSYPRWGDYAPRAEDNEASHGFRVAVYSLIAGLISKKIYKKPVNLEKLVCRALFHSMKVTITGSMRHKTRRDELLVHLIEERVNQGKENVVDYLSGSMRDVFHDYIIHAEDHSFEGRLVDAMSKFDSMIFCHREVEFGSSFFFPNQFEELKRELETHEIDSVRYMMEQFNEKKDFYLFLFSVMMLDRIERWNGRISLIKDNDATHSYRTTCIAVFNAVLEKYKDGYKYNGKINLLKVAAKTLLHDLVERETGDVLGPFKHSSPEIKAAFAAYEKRESIKMVKLLPEFLQEEFTDYMVYAKDDSYEGYHVDIADKIDALIKTNMERRINPHNFEMDYREQVEKLQIKFGETPCVVFFLAFILHDLNYAKF